MIKKATFFVFIFLSFFISINVKAADCTNLFDTGNFHQNFQPSNITYTQLTSDSFSVVSSYSDIKYRSNDRISFKIPNAIGIYILSYDIEYTEGDVRTSGSTSTKYYSPYILLGDPNDGTSTSYITFEQPSYYLNTFPTHYEYEYEVLQKYFSNYLLYFYTYSYGNYPIIFKNIRLYKKEDYATCSGQALLYTLTFNISPISIEYTTIEITDGENTVSAEDGVYKLESDKKYNISISANGYETYTLSDYSINDNTTLDIELQLSNAPNTSTDFTELIPYLVAIIAVLMLFFMRDFIRKCFYRR